MKDKSELVRVKLDTSAYTHLTPKEVEGELKLDELEELAKGWVDSESANNRAIINAKAKRH